MPLSGLDPSMLVGFLCRDEQDWRDLRARVSEVCSFCQRVFILPILGNFDSVLRDSLHCTMLTNGSI